MPAHELLHRGPPEPKLECPTNPRGGFTQLYSWEAMDRAIGEIKPWKDSVEDGEYLLEDNWVD